MNTTTLRLMLRLDQAGETHDSIADSLNSAGVPVPRDADPRRPSRRDGPLGVQPRNDGYCLDTAPGNPSRWTAAAVSQVLAAPELTGGGIGNARHLALTIV
jgi:hypothetical protein